MCKDRNQELQRLEQALLEEEEEDLLSEETLNELLEDVAPAKNSVPYQNYSNDYGQPYTAYNSDTTDTDLEEYSEEVLSADKPSYTGLIVLACLLAIGILGMVIYLMLRYGGIL